MKLWVGTSLLFLTLSQVAIAGGDFLKSLAGHYEGTLTSHLDDQFSQVSVKSDISSDKKAMKNFVVTGENGKNLFILGFQKISDKELTVTSQSLDSPIKLKRDQECFSDQATQRLNICFYRDLVTIEMNSKDQVPQYSISLNKFARENPTPQEPPQSISLSDAIKKTWAFNFDNRIEFEHVMQAKYTAKASRRKLLPQLSFNSIMNNLTPTFITVLQSAGEFLPFLFPSKWIQVKRTGLQSEAELDGMTLMRLDTATQIEALFYNYENDKTVEGLYSKTLEKAQGLRDEIQAREVDLGTVAEGSTDNMKSIINFMEQDHAILQALLKEDRAAIAQVMGFYNPLAVSDAQIGQEQNPITNAKFLNADDVIKTALQRSVELRQLDFLIGDARLMKKQVYFNWLDPNSDPPINMGFGFKSYLTVAASQIMEIQIRRDQMKSLLEQKAFNAVTDYNQTLSSYSVAAEGQAIQDRRLDQMDMVLQVKGKVDLFALVQIFQDYLTAGIRAQANILAYRVARARVDRLLLQGVYFEGSMPAQIKRSLN